MGLAVRTFATKAELDAALPDLARLRITVFRDWPYLYDGDAASEESYLAEFAASQDAVCIAAYDGDAMVGASTGLPLAHEHATFKRPFEAAGMDVSRIFYCAESVLLPTYRGQGLYRAFMAGREAHARRLGGFALIAFCGVVRPDDHPARPGDAAPLDPVWRHFGYDRRDDLTTTFKWKDVGEAEETRKPMRFWTKGL